jgi:hypothetical protein
MLTFRPQKLTFCLFFLAIITQRLTLVQGGKPVPVALLLYLVAAALLYLCKGVTVRRSLLITILTVMCLLILTTISTTSDFSINSLVYCSVLYLPFALVPSVTTSAAPAANEGYRWFSSMMCFFALIALYQFGAQAYLGIPYSDPLAALPDGMTMAGYEVSYPIRYGSPIYKSNAYLFLEPSFLSQFLALALLVEIIMFRRLLAVVLQILGLITTFSGTGLVLVAITLPLALLVNLRNRRLALLGSIAVIAISGAVLSNPAVLERSGEINDPGSSASIRFSTPYERMMELSLESASSLLIGYGAGSADRLKLDDRLANFPAVPKAIIEYGLIGGIPLLLLIAVRIFMGIGSLPLAVGLLCMQFLLSGALLQPLSVFTLFYFFSTQPRRAVNFSPIEPSHTSVAA